MIPVDLVEIERKRALGEWEPLEDRLREAGFAPTGPVVEVDTYYSRPDVDFLETVECLRVRESAGRCEVTYKPASDGGAHGAGGVVAKQETNVALADGGEAAHAHRLLEALGMVLLARVEKSRTCYRAPGRPDLSVVVDAVAGVGSFVETELVSSDEREDVVRRLEEVERLLGLEALPVVTLPYRDLVLAAAVSRGAAEQGPPADGAVHR
ncbi:class IV adenylate cyclase [Nocardiopsis flavescens]|uniref:Adenylate cyclase, class 2 n=1 Tax=Nocardiopsis flavescens TaxID=758803 RepID=A0A1M6GMP4_9ACTN|nr:adenylate cyclase, class 2 [Nocardiopsis flavescens]